MSVIVHLFDVCMVTLKDSFDWTAMAVSLVALSFPFPLRHSVRRRSNKQQQHCVQRGDDIRLRSQAHHAHLVAALVTLVSACRCHPPPTSTMRRSSLVSLLLLLLAVVAVASVDAAQGKVKVGVYGESRVGRVVR